MFLPRRRRISLVALLASLAVAGAAFAQRGFGSFREGSFPPIYAPLRMPDAGFVLCRLQYTSARYEPSGIGWATDYPYAEINLTTRLSELTRTPVSRTASEEPRHFVVRMTDDQLFNCPVVLASDAGTMGISDGEAVRLRDYLDKGGFLWADDFWGEEAWYQFAREMAKVLPPDQFPFEDVGLDDPMLRSQFELSRIPQITNIQFWRRSGGLDTSERFDSAEVHLRAIRDAHGRIMVLASHNTDVADAWEREGEDPAYFEQFSREGYALGINVMLHALTH